jgi:hypothetical protein
MFELRFALKLLTASRREFVEVVAGEPFRASGEGPRGLIAHRIGPIPYLGRFDRCCIGPGIPSGLYFQAQRADARRVFAWGCSIHGARDNLRPRCSSTQDGYLAFSSRNAGSRATGAIHVLRLATLIRYVTQPSLPGRVILDASLPKKGTWVCLSTFRFRAARGSLRRLCAVSQLTLLQRHSARIIARELRGTNWCIGRPMYWSLGGNHGEGSSGSVNG